MKPFSTRETPLEVSSDGCVVVSGSGYAHGPEGPGPRICLYKVDEGSAPGTEKELLEKLVHTIETRDIYHTTQDNGNSGLDSASDIKVPWNLRKTYGIYTGPFEYLGLIRENRR